MSFSFSALEEVELVPVPDPLIYPLAESGEQVVLVTSQPLFAIEDDYALLSWALVTKHSYGLPSCRWIQLVYMPTLKHFPEIGNLLHSYPCYLGVC